MLENLAPDLHNEKRCNACEYAYLPERMRWEVDTRMGKITRELLNPPNNPITITGARAQVGIQRLEVLPQMGPNAQLVKLNQEQVDEYLENFNKLHHRILCDPSSRECYKIIGVNYSQTTPTIESFEVQFQECPSAVTYQFNEAKQMLLRSFIVVE